MAIQKQNTVWLLVPKIDRRTKRQLDSKAVTLGPFSRKLDAIFEHTRASRTHKFIEKQLKQSWKGK